MSRLRPAARPPPVEPPGVAPPGGPHSGPPPQRLRGGGRPAPTRTTRRRASCTRSHTPADRHSRGRVSTVCQAEESRGGCGHDRPVRARCRTAVRHPPGVGRRVPDRSHGWRGRCRPRRGSVRSVGVVVSVPRPQAVSDHPTRFKTSPTTGPAGGRTGTPAVRRGFGRWCGGADLEPGRRGTETGCSRSGCRPRSRPAATG